MSSQDARRIVQERMSEPHVEGRRVPVLTLRVHVEERGQDPQAVAEQFDLDVADVYRALAYYHEHPEEMQQVRRERERAFDGLEAAVQDQRPDDVTPPADDG